jgi:hypothetical protein
MVSLELGGSNDIANIYPEKANAHPGLHIKDKLETKLHDMVCAGQIKLHAARQQIAGQLVVALREGVRRRAGRLSSHLVDTATVVVTEQRQRSTPGPHSCRAAGEAES